MTHLFQRCFAYLLNFHEDRQAATIVEYSIMIALIAAICFAAIQAVGFEAADFWNTSADQMGEAVTESISQSNLQ